MNNQVTENEEEQTEEETADEGESDKAEGIDGTPAESSKGVEEEDKGSDTSVEELDHKMLRTFTKPKATDELVNSWWETVMSTFQLKKNKSSDSKEPEEEVEPEKGTKVVSSTTNVRLLLSQEPENQQGETKAKEDIESIVSTNGKAIADHKSEFEDVITKIERTPKQEKTNDNSVLVDNLNMIQNATTSNNGGVASLEKAEYDEYKNNEESESTKTAKVRTKLKVRVGKFKGQILSKT